MKGKTITVPWEEYRKLKQIESCVCGLFDYIDTLDESDFYIRFEEAYKISLENGDFDLAERIQLFYDSMSSAIYGEF